MIVVTSEHSVTTRWECSEFWQSKKPYEFIIKIAEKKSKIHSFIGHSWEQIM